MDWLVLCGLRFGSHSGGLDFGSSGSDGRQIHSPAKALHVLFRDGLCGMYLHALWNRAWGVHDTGPKSGIGERVVCAEGLR